MQQFLGMKLFTISQREINLRLLNGVIVQFLFLSLLTLFLYLFNPFLYLFFPVSLYLKNFASNLQMQW